jgi:hypothetical protein
LDKLSKNLKFLYFKKMKKLLFSVLIIISASRLFAQNSLADVVGNYKFDGAPFEKIVISISGSSVIAEAEGVGKGEIFPTKTKDEYTEPNNNAVLVFNRDANGTVISLTVKVQGNELKGMRESAAYTPYLGKYKFAVDSAIPSMLVSLKNGQLFGETDQGSAVLKPTAKKDVFEIIGYDGSVEFFRDSNGNMTKVVLRVNDIVLDGEKQ